jgi:hypothetical protein
MASHTIFIPDRYSLLIRAFEGWRRTTRRTATPAAGERCPLRPGLLRDAGLSTVDVECDLAASGGIGDFTVAMGRDGLELRRSRSAWHGTTLPV